MSAGEAETATEPKLLASIERWNVGLGVLLTLGAALIKPTLAVVGGVAIGASIAGLNFHVLRRLVERIGRARSKGLLVAAVLLKTGLLMTSVWLVLKLLPVHVVAFTVGLSVFLVSIFLAAIQLASARTEQV